MLSTLRGDAKPENAQEGEVGGSAQPLSVLAAQQYDIAADFFETTHSFSSLNGIDDTLRWQPAQPSESTLKRGLRPCHEAHADNGICITGTDSAVYVNPCFELLPKIAAGDEVLQDETQFHTPSCEYVIQETCCTTLDAAAMAGGAQLPRVAAANLITPWPASRCVGMGDSSGGLNMSDDFASGEWDAWEPSITLKLGGVPATGTDPSTGKL